jgi:hypothetical protein
MPTACLCVKLTRKVAMTQIPRTPDVEAQRAAMKRLDFLNGKWSGEAKILVGPDAPQDLNHTESAEYKLNGLLLVIEGVGRTKSDSKPALQAFGIVSFDDESQTYHIRAFNDGRYLETEVKLAADGKGMSWGFVLGAIRTSAVLRIDDAGHWTEQHEIMIGDQPPRKLMEVNVARES